MLRVHFNCTNRIDRIARSACVRVMSTNNRENNRENLYDFDPIPMDVLMRKYKPERVEDSDVLLKITDLMAKCKEFAGKWCEMGDER